MFRFKILQVRLEHSKEKIDIVSRLRDFEDPLVSASRTGISLFTRPSRRGDHGGFVLARIREGDGESELARDQIDCAQPQSELFQKPAEDEKQRLGGLDLM